MSNNSNETIEGILNLGPVMPVVVIDDTKDALPLADALLAGGLKTIEITLRTQQPLVPSRWSPANALKSILAQAPLFQPVWRKPLAKLAPPLRSRRGPRQLSWMDVLLPTYRYCLAHRLYQKS